MRTITRSRGWIIATVGCAMLAGTLTMVSSMGTGRSGGAHPGAATASSGGTGGGGTSIVSATLMPVMAAAPAIAVMPTSASRAPASTGPAKPGGSAAPSGPAAPSSPAAPSGGPTPSPAASGSGSCAHPQYVTSDPNGMWNQAPYFVANNMWNAGNYRVSQTLYACSYSDWYVVATANNDSGDGAVKTYPNSHRDFDNSPQINSFKSITSTFAETSPHTGIYEDAYDIWLNGIANSGSTEVMIWNDNEHQVPSGSVQAKATFGGRSYAVWKSGSYIAFVADTNFTAGTIDLLAVFKWIMKQGWIPANSTLGQVDYGAEIVSTNNAPATFGFSSFAVNTS